jgi:hypothetical protein
MGNSEWAINARYITAVGSLLFGFDVNGNLWSYDTLLFQSRDMQINYPDVTAITSDGKRLIFVNNGTIIASSSDLTSLDFVTFEPFTYDESFNQVTAMTWLYKLVCQ